MLRVHEGQCGLCAHFGEQHAKTPILVNILKSKQAPDNMVDSCGLPKNADLHLKVTAISGCDGFEFANAA